MVIITFSPITFCAYNILQYNLLYKKHLCAYICVWIVYSVKYNLINLCVKIIFGYFMWKAYYHVSFF